MINIADKVKLIKKSDFLILLTIITIAVSWIAIQALDSNTQKLKAVISHNGIVIKELELSLVSDGITVLQGSPDIQYETNGGKIRFVNSSCADHRCEKYGYLDRPNQLAVCLPNRVTISIKGGQADVDMILG